METIAKHRPGGVWKFAGKCGRNATKTGCADDVIDVFHSVEYDSIDICMYNPGMYFNLTRYEECFICLKDSIIHPDGNHH